ncbi:MAG: methyl-accepting chemotaxis protein [Waterburya sp.]
MLNILNIFPPSLILLTVILVILPTVVAILLRQSLYRYLISSSNKVSRLISYESRGKQPQIVENLEARFKQASQNLEQVNTIALIDGLYSQERLNFLGISLRCEQWDFFCQTLPNLLLAFGLLGTFFGISSNLYNLSQTINQSTTSIDNLVAQLQIPLQNMGIAFSTSLAAILCSSILIIVNLRYNTNFAKSLLISSLEDYLDNIFKINVQGDTRLDKAVDRMVKQQQEFLERFHDKVGQVLEATMGNAANKMVAANQGFQNNVDSMVNRFNDISSSMATSTNSFQESTFSLKEQMQTVTKIVPKFETAANKIESSSQKYLQGAEKIEASKFSENLENMTTDLANTQKAFSQSTAFLGNQVHKISESHQQATELAQQVYTQLQTTSNKLQDSSLSFIEAADTFKQSDFADKLITATNELVTIPQQFNQSTTTLHQSTDAIGRAIDNINIFTQETNSLIEQVNKLSHKSGELLEKSDRNIQQEIASFENIQSELQRLVITLDQHKQQVNTGLMNFGERIFTSFEKQTSNNIVELQKLTSGINNNLNSLQQTQTETVKLINILESYKNNFQSINSNLSNLASTSEQHGKQVNSNLNGIGMMSDRLLTSFEQRSQNNTQEIIKLTAELKQVINQIHTIPVEINDLIKAIKQHEQQMNSNLNNLGNNITNKANQQINNYNQQIQKLTEQFNKIH